MISQPAPTTLKRAPPPTQSREAHLDAYQTSNGYVHLNHMDAKSRVYELIHAHGQWATIRSRMWDAPAFGFPGSRGIVVFGFRGPILNREGRVRPHRDGRTLLDRTAEGGLSLRDPLAQKSTSPPLRLRLGQALFSQKARRAGTLISQPSLLFTQRYLNSRNLFAVGTLL
jgi:hypothetical protein